MVCKGQCLSFCLIIALSAGITSGLYSEWQFEGTLASLTPNGADVQMDYLTEDAKYWFEMDETLGRTALSIDSAFLKVHYGAHGASGSNPQNLYVLQYTVSVYIKPNSFEYPVPLFVTHAVDNTPNLVLTPSGSIQSGFTSLLVPDGTVVLGEWNRISWTVVTSSNKSTLKLLCNGALYGPFLIDIGSAYWVLSPAVSANWGSPVYFTLFEDQGPFNVSISRIQFFDYALNDTELQAAQDILVSTVAPGPLSEWSFNVSISGNEIPSLNNDLAALTVVTNLRESKGNFELKYDPDIRTNILLLRKTMVYLKHGAASNAEGHYVNQYSFFVDMKLHSNMKGNPSPIYNTDDQALGASELQVSAQLAVGYNDTINWNVSDMGHPNQFPLDRWVQLGFTVNTLGFETKIYLDGQLLRTMPIPFGWDDVWSLYPTVGGGITLNHFTMFAELAGESTANVSISRIRFWDFCLSELQALSTAYPIGINGTTDDSEPTPPNSTPIESDSSSSLNVIAASVAAVFGTLVLAAAIVFVGWRFRKQPKVEIVNMSVLQAGYIDGHIEVLDQVGKGNFGAVLRGRWHETEVALKKLSQENSEDFKKEADTLCQLQHPNIVRCYGLYRYENDEYLVMDFFAKGSLLQLLRKKGESLSTKAKMQILISAAKGMSFLESKGILHLDFSARNILVTEVDGRYQSKIADFGMSKSVDTGSVSSALPIRWTAPECLKSHKPSTKSDVYSFGVVVWEVFTNGLEPYSQLRTNKEVCAYVLSGKRLPKPQDCPNEMHNLMMLCWLEDPEQRPTFASLIKHLEDLWDDPAPLPLSSLDDNAKNRYSHPQTSQENFYGVTDLQDSSSAYIESHYTAPQDLKRSVEIV